MQTTRGILILCVTLVLVLAVLPDRADAGAIRLIAERDVASGGSDFFLLSYPSLTDMLAGIGLTQQALSLPLSSAFSISGLTMDGSAYRMIAERDVASAGSDFFLLSYPSLTDMLAGTGLTQQALPLPLSSAFSISGLTMDGSAYRMIAERDVASGGADFFLLSYPSLADTLAGTGLTQQALPLPLSSAFSISGLTMDGSAYRMIAERDVASAGSDFFLLSYPSLTDMLAGTGLTQQALPLPLSSAFSISGFLIEPDAIPPASVPAPASAVLMLVGLLLFLRRR